MKILYLAPEHVSGTLTLFKQEHERRGDECRFVTFWHSRWDFPDDICLNLGGMPNQSWVRALRKVLTHDPYEVPSRIEGNQVPIWNPNPFARALFCLRDERNWRTIWKAIERYGLLDFDILHLDGGADFTRDARFARAFRKRNKGVVSYFHGSDLRSRGYIPAVDAVTDLRLTPEWDLAVLDERLHYLYLPVDLSRFEIKPFAPGNRIRIGHAARNPLKGSNAIVAAVEELSKSHNVELVMIKDMTYADALAAKQTCDIFVDQLTNEGGWGYGMSGVEALAMGIPVITNIPADMRDLIGEHPFIQADAQNIAEVLRESLESQIRLQEISQAGREWVLNRHSIKSVADELYSHYRRLGWTNG
jgi:glycosyltransferase involved in cell wall biosynthesis